tara:strand:+ start:1213 stop:1863 length:651 start_codon:yes stop_codon:yes gene_type:complete
MWKIGFEFEFNKIRKEYIKSTGFIEKWVKDKTCYIEAVTYPVELLPDNKKRNIVFDLINKDSIILNEGRSGKNCGGHITVSKKGLTGKELFIEFKKFMPLLYTLYYQRLKYRSCHRNVFLKEGEDNKFCTVRVKKYLLEIRLFPMIESIDDVFYRYKLIQKISHAIDHNLSYENFLNSVDKLVEKRYRDFSYHFKTMIEEQKSNKFVRKYLINENK